MFGTRTRIAAPAVGALIGSVLAAPVSASVAARPAPDPNVRRTAHVLLISVDGMHQSDLAWYAGHHPRSTLAALVRGGVEYTHARTQVPSDSFPGMVGQTTGGHPSSTGIYYDVSYNHALLPAGTTRCRPSTPRGAVVAYDESLDRNVNRLDAGQGLPNLPHDILAMTANPQRLINPANLPVNPRTCRPVYPHSYLKVNTIFEVARTHGLRTAWSDKHPAYEILNGPSGTGVQDLFTPEINSQAIGYPAGEAWTDDNAATARYDGYKVQAVLNEVDGYNHSRTAKVGTPAIFGMNFQTVSTAQKLPTSDGLAGGYLPGGTTPGPLLSRALNFVNGRLGAMIAEIYAQRLGGSTTIILSAKHGQSPQDPRDLTRIDDGPIIAGLDAAWAHGHPSAPALVAAASDDDIMQLWLANPTPAATSFAKHYLATHPATGNTTTGRSRTLAASGLATIYAGPQAAAHLGVAAADPRHPDILGLVQHGVVYTGGTSKIAEHGGADPSDRNVPLLIAGAAVTHHTTSQTPVETTQIAPTILQLLGLNPDALQAVRAEHTQPLPAP